MTITGDYYKESYCCCLIINAWIIKPIYKYELLYNFPHFWCLVLVIHKSTGSQKKQENSRKNIYFSSLIMLKTLTVWITIHYGKFLKTWEYQTHPTCLLQNLYAGQESTVRTGHRTMDWFQIGEGICQGYIFSPCLFKLHVDYIMRNAGLNEAQAGSRLLGEIWITSDIQMTPSLWQKAKRNWSTSWESERGNWKSWLKTQHSENKDHGIQSHHFMANRCGNNGNSDRLYFLGLHNHYGWWHEFEPTLGDGDRQGSLACCSLEPVG